MQPEELVHLLVRGRRFVFLVILSAMLTALLLTYVISEKYQSSTIVLLQPQKSLDLVPKRAEILNFPVGLNTPVETGSTTYSEIIKSRAIAEKIVLSLRLDQAAEAPVRGFLGLWREAATSVKKTFMRTWTFLKFGRIPYETPFNEAVEETVDSLSVKPTKDSYLFEIVARARSPQRAADIANSATAAFTQYIRQVSAADNASTTKRSEEQLRASERTLNSSRKALADYKRKHGIASLTKETEVEVEILSGLESSLQTIVTKTAGLSARRAELQRKLGETDSIARSSSTVIDNPLLRELRMKLANNEMRLARLGELYTPKHKEYEEIVAENRQIDEVLKQVPPTLDSEQVMQVNPLYQTLVTDLTTVETDLAALDAERERLKAAIDAKKAVIAQIPSREATVAHLELAVALNEDAHRIVTKEYEELSTSVTKGIPTIEVVHAAVPSAYPVSPIKIYNVAMAAILGALVSIALLMALNGFGMTYRSEKKGQARAAAGSAL